jgi:glyceraldehyde 3-phosphate dehydrogenase
MTRIAVNGFGRIGRNTLRALLERDSDLEVVAVNDLTEPAALAQLLKYDSSLGRLGKTVEVDGDTLVVDGRRIKVLAERDPANLPWAELGVEVVLESTGRFTAADAAKAHLDAGAKKVLVSAPSDGADVTLAYGVNTDAYDPAAHTIISNASCTTNALAPLAQVLDDLAGIEHGFMTTVHAYTQEQNLQDGPHRDPRRARAAGVNIVPTTTGAAKAIGLVLPGLDGKLSGDSIRVPVPVGSIVELNTTVSRDVTRDEVLEAYRTAASGRLAGVLEYSDDPLVSSDITGNPASAIFDSALTRVEGKHVKVVAWYDNEWGFSNRVIDTLELLAGLHSGRCRYRGASFDVQNETDTPPRSNTEGTPCAPSSSPSSSPSMASSTRPAAATTRGPAGPSRRSPSSRRPTRSRAASRTRPARCCSVGSATTNSPLCGRTWRSSPSTTRCRSSWSRAR